MAEKMVDLPGYSYLVDFYDSYANPKDKIARECGRGTFTKLKQGIYVTRAALEEGIPMGLIANRLYGPSYISFAYALRLYSLIPEDVPNPTSATFCRRRKKRFDTSLCSFYYRDVPARAYPEEIVYRQTGRWRFLSASPEKALCDELSTVTGIRSKKAMRALLFDDLRIDESGFEKLDRHRIVRLVPLYASPTLDMLLSLCCSL